MFLIGKFKDKVLAEEVSAHLRKKGISNKILQSGEFWELGIENKEDTHEAFEEYKRAIGIPPKFEIDPKWNKIRSLPEGRLTLIFIFISILVFIFFLLPQGEEALSFLFFARNEKKFMAEILQGQVWRLITPVFLHFGFLHIIFNLLWLRDLGKVLENKNGSVFFAIFFTVIAVASNFAQYLTTGPQFGGMSGVVYGFLGYLWMYSTFNPESEISLPKNDIYMMVIWFFLCMLGLIGNIANTAHGIGLSLGMIIGIWDGGRGEKFLLPKFFKYLGVSLSFTLLTFSIEYLKFGKKLYFFNFI
jgi:GlpG protein